MIWRGTCPVNCMILVVTGEFLAAFPRSSPKTIKCLMRSRRISGLHIPLSSTSIGGTLKSATFSPSIVFQGTNHSLFEVSVPAIASCPSLNAYPKSVVTYFNFPLAICKLVTCTRILYATVTFQHALLSFRIGS